MVFANLWDGVVVQLFETTEGRDIYEYFHPDMVWVNIDDHPEVQNYWVGHQQEDGEWTFTPPVPPVLTEAEIAMRNNQTVKNYSEAAIKYIIPILLAYQLGNITEDQEKMAVIWQDYYTKLTTLDLKEYPAAWPTFPV